MSFLGAEGILHPALYGESSPAQAAESSGAELGEAERGVPRHVQRTRPVQNTDPVESEARLQNLTPRSLKRS